MAATAAGIKSRVALETPSATDRPAALVRENFGFVWRLLRRYGVSEAEAGDAAQRVFVVATERVDRIEPGKERSFLFTTVLRVADKVRRASARAAKDSELDPEQAASPWPSLEELVDQRRARALLDAILERMNEELRAVFVLYELEQMTVKDIAALLGIAQGTAASRLRRAREFFREHAEAASAPAGDAK
jgi:RNA polymerase sigma-70 factor (ECF subfamily)